MSKLETEYKMATVTSKGAASATGKSQEHEEQSLTALARLRYPDTS